MNPPVPDSSRDEVKELWRARLADAKSRYEFAVAQFRSASEDFRAHHFPTPDGGMSVHLAIVAESSARKEYMRALRLFTDLLLYGEIPRDTDLYEKSGNGNPATHFPSKTQ